MTAREVRIVLYGFGAGLLIFAVVLAVILL
jgi:hypothetical protein